MRVVCADDCPVLPRSMIFGRFQAPGWYASAPEEDLNRQVYGIGPYKLVEWRPDIDIQMEIYEDYVPNPDSSVVDGQAPHIKNLTNVWRGEELVRSAMIRTGEGRLGRRHRVRQQNGSATMAPIHHQRGFRVDSGRHVAP